MEYAKLLRPIFVIVFIGIIYIIIFMALRIMAKDVKNGDRKKVLKKSLGLEVVETSEDTNLKKGSIIPIHRTVTMGRKDDNTIILNDPYVSGYHAKIYIKNLDCILEDNKSTNGTLLNDEKVTESIVIEAGDEIKVGSTIFRVIG